MKLKLCGLRFPEDIAMVNEYDPDYAGFVFAGTKRRVTPEAAAELGARLNSGVKKVGVFVNEPPEALAAAAKAAALDAVQLHGDETEEYIQAVRGLFGGEIWKAVRVRCSMDVKEAQKLSADMLLFDSFVQGEYGGSGKRADLSAILSADPKKPFFLAGGLNAQNIEEILTAVRPYGLDISSGFETDGKKDRLKLKALMNALKGRL